MRIKWILITVFVLFALLAISSVVSAGITYNTASNKIAVIGYSEALSCNFIDLYNADKAGNLTLWTGTPTINIVLTTQIKPSDELALKIDFILAGSGAGAGDTINITGTDKDGNAQSETLTTEADGTFTTTWFKTVTDIDCNGFNTGTLTVRQNQWGVIWKLTDNEFRIECQVQLGNSSADGYFGDVNKAVYIDNNDYYFFTQAGHGHLRLGEESNVAEKTGKNGCVIVKKAHTTMDYIFTAMKTINLYDTTLKIVGNSGRAGYSSNTNGRIWDCKFDRIYPYGTPNNLDIFSLTITNNKGSSDYGSYNSLNPGNVSNMFYYSCYYPIYIRMNFNADFTIRNVVARDYHYLFRFRRSSGTTNIYAIDWDVPVWSFSYRTSANCVTYRQYSFDLNVVDSGGVGIHNASVQIYDTNSDLVVNTTTDINGSILTQTLNYGYYRSSGNVLRTPHTINVFHSNYSSSSFIFTMDDKIDWTIALENRSWNYSQPLAWKIINLTDTTILKLSSDGNLAIAGVLYELTNTPPLGNTVAYQINDTLWLTKSGDLYIEGEVSEEINSALLVNSIATIFGISYLVYRKKKKGGNHDKNK